jgi:hypothetical protein
MGPLASARRRQIGLQAAVEAVEKPLDREGEGDLLQPSVALEQ